MTTTVPSDVQGGGGLPPALPTRWTHLCAKTASSLDPHKHAFCAYRRSSTL